MPAVTVVRAAPLPLAAASSPASPGSSASPSAGPSYLPANDRLQPTRAAIVGMRESRAMAALAADLVSELAGAKPPGSGSPGSGPAGSGPAGAAEFDTLRTRLREVVEIGSARDTGGPLAALYAAARRDSASALARILSPAAAADRQGFSQALAQAGQELRELDERFAARDFALTGPPLPKLTQGQAAAQPQSGTSASGLDLVV